MTLRSIPPAGIAERAKDRGRLFVGMNLPFGMPLDAERERRGIRNDERLDQAVVGCSFDDESFSEPVHRLRMQGINRGAGLSGDILEQTVACK